MARAASVELVGTTLHIGAQSGEALDVSARIGDAGEVDVDLADAAGVSVPTGCALDDSTLSCSAHLVVALDVTGGAGDDRVSVRGALPLVVHGGAGDDVLRGGDGADLLDGGDGVDVLDGRDGDDELLGGDGADRLNGGAGDDVLDGGAGDDAVSGAAGADLLRGGDGSDRLSGEVGDDQLDGGAGDDAIDGGDDSDTLLGGDGHDTLLGGDGGDAIDGQGGEDWIDGGNSADALRGGDGDDMLLARADGDRIVGGEGTDTVDHSLAPGPLNIDLSSGEVRSSGPAISRFDDLPDVVIGSPFDDVLRGTDDAGVTLFGGAGNDVLTGGAQADRLDGGDGRDTADYSERRTGVVIHADGTPVSGAPGEGDLVTPSVEVLVGGSGNDDLVGAPGASELIGGAGDDQLEDLLDDAYDLLRCGDGDDTAVADRTDQVDADCERWSNGAQLVRSIDPITAAVRSPRLAIDRSGRMRVSLACSREAVGSCRALLTVELRHAGKWRRGVRRSVLLTPGRRRSVTVFAQRGFQQLLARPHHHLKARVQVDVRDAIGRRASDRRELPLSLPSSPKGAR
ncbi:MAG: calcium-binding protein [Patulibacter sp.]